MIFHENCLLFSKIKKDVAKFLVCCNRDLRFKGYSQASSIFETVIFQEFIHIISVTFYLSVQEKIFDLSLMEKL